VADVAINKPRTKIIGPPSLLNSPYIYRKYSITGICFGHQVVARALGGECAPNGGQWEVAITQVGLTDLGQRIFGVPSLVR
jgi:GMP synthase-like glutamine amidotransferase